MARKSKEQKLIDIHAEALSRFDEIQSAQRDERMQALGDRRFYSIAGAQWEGPLEEQFENRPRFEVNKVHLAVIRIINEYRNNRITVNFVSKDGSGADDLAETCNGLYRADEQDSCAEEAYDNAFEEAVGGGMGAWRLRAVYEDEEDEENEYQRIRMEPIVDADSCVFFDPASQRQDKSDAKYCFVLTAIPRDQYSVEWDDDPATWPKDIQQTEFDWLQPDVVFISEYYVIEEKKQTIHVFEDVAGVESRYTDEDLEDDDGELLKQLEAIGTRKVRERVVKRKRVHKYIMSGGKVLEDCGYIPGKMLPVIVVYGKRWFVDSVERFMGHVRLAKDAQRLKNMQLSRLGEISSLSTVSKPILTPEQVAGHQVMWSEDNIKNYPYLLINPMTDMAGNPMPAGPLAYTKPPEIPPAMAALLQITEQDMQDILGNQAGAEKLVSNVSGKTVEAIQQRLDMQTFIYMSNMAKAVRRCGEVWLSMAREIYVEDGRRMKTVGTQGDHDSVVLSEKTLDDKGVMITRNDIGEASFDVVADVGPSSSSKREATVRSLTNMMAVTEDPETRQVLQATALLNMEGEGLSDVREWFRKRLVQMGVMKPTDEEAAQMANAQQQPDPNTVFLQAAAEEATAKAAKARADVVKTIADAELSRAKTVETLSGVDIAEQQQAVNNVQLLQQAIAQQAASAQPPSSGEF